MTNFKITYEQALKIVAAKDKAYVDDIMTLLSILKKRPSHATIEHHSGIGTCLDDYVRQKYHDEMIKKAEGFIVSDCLKRIEDGTF